MNSARLRGMATLTEGQGAVILSRNALRRSKVKLSGTKFFGLALIALFSLSSSGCAVTPRSRISQPSFNDADSRFLSPAPEFSSSEFHLKWPGSLSEQDKIRYLLERIAGSKEKFVRNGQVFEGSQARLWLLYKLGHWVNGVKTADDFIARVASFSKKTGELYVVEFSDGKNYSLKTVLSYELSAFEKNRVAFNGQTKAPSASPQVSIPAVLATRTSQ